jgi:hypothetical protein
MVREHQLVLYLGVFLLYLLADRVMHGLGTSEIVRKTQLEADQRAAQQIQKTLQPEKLEELAGYEMAVFYEPFRAVGGDYFDVIALSGNRTLSAVADVSGKGMPGSPVGGPHTGSRQESCQYGGGAPGAGESN